MTVVLSQETAGDDLLNLVHTDHLKWRLFFMCHPVNMYFVDLSFNQWYAFCPQYSCPIACGIASVGSRNRREIGQQLFSLFGVNSVLLIQHISVIADL